MNKTVLFFCFLILALFYSNAVYAVTTLTIREKSGVTTENYPLTFGHVFKQGDITAGLAVSINGQLQPTQFDIKRRYPDNSVKHAVISVVLPIIRANEDLVLTLVPAAANSSAGAMTKTQILATGVQSTINLTGLSGSGYSGNLTADLNQAIDEETDLTYWLYGPVMTEILVNQRLNNSLNAAWEVRFYPGWDGIRISNAMENVEGNFRGNVDYAVEIQLGDNNNPLSSHYSKPTFQHNHNARWRKVLWIGNEPPEVEIRYDRQYFIDSKTVLNYDTSVSVSESTINTTYARWQNTDHDIMGTGYINTWFGTSGDREEIGHLPTWTVRYLLTTDNRLREVMLNHAEMASSIPVHYRESDPGHSFFGHIISIDDRPTIWIGDPRGDNYPDALPTPIGDLSTVWNVDLAHQTSFAYIPYIVTGEKYYLDELYFWSGYDIGASNYSYRERETGLIKDQVRGEAWAIRVLTQAAAIAPIGDLEQDYIHEKVQNNIDAWRTEINDPNHHPLHTWGDFTCWGVDGGRPTSAIIGCEADRTGTGSGVNEDVYPVRHISLPWHDDYMLISLCHMKELGYDTQDILAWIGEYTINRYSHPDASWYNGGDYKYPSTYALHVNNPNPYYDIPTWKQVTDSFTNIKTAFSADNPISYPRKAYAALSCIFDVTVQQTSYIGAVTQTRSGQQVYDWLATQFGNNNDVWNDNPTWAILPRDGVAQGDINADGSVDLTDAILSLQVAAGMTPGNTTLKGETTGDGRIGVADTIDILNK